MAKKKTEEFLKIEYGEEKGRGTITFTNPLQFAHGKIYFESKYSPKSVDSTVRFGCEFEEGCEHAYADELVFYDGDKVLKTIRRHKTSEHFTEEYNRFIISELHDFDETYEPKQILDLLTAQNLNLRLVSRVRKYDDVKIAGSEMKEFQYALQALVELVSNQQAHVQYICQHDDSFESLYNAQKVEKKQKRQAEKQEENSKPLNEEKEKRDKKPKKKLSRRRE